MSPKLKRVLNLWEVVIYGVGIILGAGIYVLIGSAAGIAGNMVWLSFLLSALVAGFTAVSYAELSTMFPTSGAEFVYAREAFGSDALAWIIGFCAVIIGFSTASAVAVGFAGYFALFFSADIVVVSFFLIVTLSLISFWGINESAKFNALATSIEVGGLMIIVLIGGYYLLMGVIPFADLGELPVIGNDTRSIIPVVSAGALIFFAFIGFEDIANIAEEAEQPHKILPKAFFYSLLISTVIYVLVAIVTVSVIPAEVLAQSDQPLALVMEHLIGGNASIIMALIALFATANTVLITLIVGARMLYGMSKNGSLPSFLSIVHTRTGTPWYSVIIMAGITVLFLFFKQIEVLASISDVGIFMLFFSVNLSNIVLRFRKPDLHRPWKAPLNVGKMPVISATGALSCLFMLIAINHPVDLFGRQFSSLFVGLVIFALSIPFYFLIGRNVDTKDVRG